MNQNLFSLAWRETVRSAYWGKSLATSIFMGILALYFSANFLFLGLYIPKILTEEFPKRRTHEQIQQHCAGVFCHRPHHSPVDAKVAHRQFQTVAGAEYSPQNNYQLSVGSLGA